MSAPPSSQFALLRQRRFAPFFWTQFLGAMNDNVLKFAFTVLVTYRLSVDWLPPALAGLAIGAVFILPFLLFSATAGQLADLLDKARVMRMVKNLELAIMALAAWGLWQGWIALLLGCIFLMGLHSTVFGPVKYAYLPQHLGERELTGGNGLVEMGTFVAILLGNVLGGVLAGLPEGSMPSSVQAVGLAGLLLASFLSLSAMAQTAAVADGPPAAAQPQRHRGWRGEADAGGRRLTGAGCAAPSQPARFRATSRCANRSASGKVRSPVAASLQR